MDWYLAAEQDGNLSSIAHDKEFGGEWRKLPVVSEQGQEAVVALLGRNDFFDEGCLAGETRRIVTVTCMTAAAIVRFQKAAVSFIYSPRSPRCSLLISWLVRFASRPIWSDQLFNSSEKRLARLLLLLDNFGNEGEPEPMIAKISQETLAEMIGATRSRVSFL